MTSINPTVIKSGVAGLAGAVLNNWMCGEKDMMQSVYFGASVGLGVGAGSYLSSITPALLPDSEGLWTGEGLMSRTFEIGGATASTWIIQKYLTRPNNNIPVTNKLLCIVLADITGEIVKDYITSQPIAFLS